MTEQTHNNIQEMIDDYYKKDRRVTLSILALVLLGVITVVISAVWIYQSKQKLDHQQLQILALQKQLDTRVGDVQDQIKCVGNYFTRQDRANIVINSLEECEIERTK